MLLAAGSLAGGTTLGALHQGILAAVAVNAAAALVIWFMLRPARAGSPVTGDSDTGHGDTGHDDRYHEVTSQEAAA